jgi:hypothetical protein
LLRLPDISWLALALVALGCSTPPPCSDCGGMCVNLQSDSANCGACGRVCAAGLRCEQGQCAATCSGLMCGDTCVDAMNDPGNCGACGFVCDAAHAQAACVAGKCSHAACEPGWFDCDFNPGNGCETLGNLCATNVCGLDATGQQRGCLFWGISDDGTRVLFSSQEPFFADDPPATDDVFLYETQTGSVQWLTRPRDAGLEAVQVQAAALSGDGTRVAFSVYGALVETDDNLQLDLYLLDLTTGVLALAPKPQDAGQISAPQEIVMSRTGRYLASYVVGSGLGAGVVWSDLETGDLQLVPQVNPGIVMSGDGRTVGMFAFRDQTVLPYVLDTRDGGLHAFLTADAGSFSGVSSFTTLALDYAADRFAVSFGSGSLADNQVWVANPLGPLPVRDAGLRLPGATGASLSSDGRLLATSEPVVSQNGMFHCSVIDMMTGERLAVPYEAGLCFPHLSGDGRTLVVTQSQLGSIVLLRVNRP